MNLSKMLLICPACKQTSLYEDWDISGVSWTRYCPKCEMPVDGRDIEVNLTVEGEIE